MRLGWRAAAAALVVSVTGLGTSILGIAGPADAAGTCADSAVPPHDIQGNGAATPIPGATVTVQAVVVGDYQGAGGLGGFYVQDEDGDVDPDPNTSEGLFVAGSPTDVSVGQRVRVEGTVAEVAGQTELIGAGAALVCASGVAVTATPFVLPVVETLPESFERIEGMAVSITQPLTVTGVEDLGTIGQVELAGGGRLVQPTSTVAPGAAAQALQETNDRRRIALDDGSAVADPTSVPYPQGGLSAGNTLRVGDGLPGLTAVLGFVGGEFRLEPVGVVTFQHANPRPVSPVAVGGEVLAASFDLGGYPAAGATAEELTRQRAKLVAALDGLGADVVAVTGVRDATAAAQLGPYAYVGGEVGVLYRPGRVAPVGASATLDHSVAQTFRVNADGAVLTVVATELADRDSACPGDPDSGDGQGACNDVRTAAAHALVDWLATDPTHSGDRDVLLLGDLESHAKEDPIGVLHAAGYVDTVTGYTSVTGGQTGDLDHALAGPSLAAQVVGATAWHINADEPPALGFAADAPGRYAPDAYRSAAHDPLLVGLSLRAPPVLSAGGPYVVNEGGGVTVAAAGTDPDGDPLTYRWDLDGNGSFETAGQRVVLRPGAQAPTTLRVGVQVSDPSGLTATASADVRVVWRFRSFLPPLTKRPALNRVEAGSTVRVRFRLGGFQGKAVLAAHSPTYTPVDCGSQAATGPARDLAQRTSLTYRRKTHTYRLGWETSPRRRGCGVLAVTLADGTTHDVGFRFVRAPHARPSKRD